MRTLPFVALASLLLAAAGEPSERTLADAAADARSRNDAVATRAISELRAAGPDGVAALLATGDARGPVLDAVCAQKDCETSRLYWYTDLEAAKAAAAASGKPILTLRMLGRLDEELSCANSRFFRITLYPDPRINEVLREKFVLHWETVRPVPKVTIDMGDGRTLSRTLTGNSAHYVLDSRGRVVDVIPGLYGPKAFLGVLERARAIAVATAALEGKDRAQKLHSFHVNSREAIVAAWSTDLHRTGVRFDSPPRAFEENLAEASRDRWEAIAMLHPDDAVLSPESERAVAAKAPSAWTAGQRAPTKRAVENPMLRQFDVLQRSLSVDGIRNEYDLHRQVHRWVEEAGGEMIEDPKTMDERVYRDLFLMPLDDPWLGLSPDGAFSGITNDGRTETARR